MKINMLGKTLTLFLAAIICVTAIQPPAYAIQPPSTSNCNTQCLSDTEESVLNEGDRCCSVKEAVDVDTLLTSIHNSKDKKTKDALKALKKLKLNLGDPVANIQGNYASIVFPVNDDGSRQIAIITSIETQAIINISLLEPMDNGMKVTNLLSEESTTFSPKPNNTILAVPCPCAVFVTSWLVGEAFNYILINWMGYSDVTAKYAFLVIGTLYYIATSGEYVTVYDDCCGWVCCVQCPNLPGQWCYN